MGFRRVGVHGVKGEEMGEEPLWHLSGNYTRKENDENWMYHPSDSVTLQ